MVLFDALLHESRTLLESGREHLSLADDVVQHLGGRIETVEKLRVPCVEGLGPRLDENVEVAVEVVLGGEDFGGDAGGFGDGDAVGNHGVDFVFEGTKGVIVAGEKGCTLENFVSLARGLQDEVGKGGRTHQNSRLGLQPE